MNKTDLKLLRFDSLFRVGIETDVHKTRMLYLTLSAILDKINEKPRPLLPPKSRMRKWRFFALRAASSLIWGGGMGVCCSIFQVCGLRLDVTELMGNANNLITIICFLPKKKFLKGKFTDSAFILSIM